MTNIREIMEKGGYSDEFMEEYLTGQITDTRAIIAVLKHDLATEQVGLKEYEDMLADLRATKEQ